MGKIEAIHVQSFENLDDLYTKSNKLATSGKKTNLRQCMDYVYRARQARSLAGDLEKVDRNDAPKTVVLHEMKKGDSSDDRSINGSLTHGSYYFYHWNLIDTFIYSSHALVTLPPADWIDAAHLHGVKILGTFKTDGDDGKSVCQRILSNKSETDKFAEVLVRLAKTHGFEGWLLNIGNDIVASKIDDLIYFVEHLTKRIHEEIEKSEIIWYDSISPSNAEQCLENLINFHKNKIFEKCDGIVLDHRYMDLFESDRPLAVYIGLDVWGPRSPGEGGLNSAYALDKIRERGLSVAILKPSWTHESFGPETFLKIEDIFWVQLIPYLYIHVCRYHEEFFLTTFCRGSGPDYNFDRENGKGKLGQPYYNLSYQRPQILVPGLHSEFTRIGIPTSTRNQVQTFETLFETITVNGAAINFLAKSPEPLLNRTEICYENAYQGGNSLELIFNNDVEYYRLFLVEIDFEETIEVNLVHRIRNNDEWQKDSLNGNPKIVVGNGSGITFLPPFAISDPDKDWRKCTYFTSLRTITEIGIFLGVKGRCCLGEIVVGPTRERIDKKLPRPVVVVTPTTNH